MVPRLGVGLSLGGASRGRRRGAIILIYALPIRGPERQRLGELASTGAIELSAVAWYELSRGPRTVEHLAVARQFFGDEGIVAFKESFARIPGLTVEEIG